MQPVKRCFTRGFLQMTDGDRTGCFVYAIIIRKKWLRVKKLFWITLFVMISISRTAIDAKLFSCLLYSQKLIH